MPPLRSSPTVAAALTAGIAVVALEALPMRLNLIVAGLLGIVVGTAADSSQGRMDPTLKLWAMILVVGALNYLSRLSFIAFFARREMPPLLAARAEVRAGGDADRADRADGRASVAGRRPTQPARASPRRVVAGAIAWRWRNGIATIGPAWSRCGRCKALL